MLRILHEYGKVVDFKWDGAWYSLYMIMVYIKLIECDTNGTNRTF